MIIDRVELSYKGYTCLCMRGREIKSETSRKSETDRGKEREGEREYYAIVFYLGNWTRRKTWLYDNRIT